MQFTFVLIGLRRSLSR